MMQNPAYPTATDAFVARKASFDALLARLTAASDEHFGVGPDDVHWGHVGSLAEAVRMLEEVVAFIAPT